MATTRAKAAMLLTALLVAVAVYGVVEVTNYFNLCVILSANTGWQVALLSVTAYIDDLVPYSEPNCAPAAFASGGEIWLGIATTGYNEYSFEVGHCATIGDSVSATLDPTYATEFTVVLANTCTSASSYYVNGHYVAYYD